MALNLRHRHAPAIIVAVVVMASMILSNQNNVHRWVADIIMVLDAIALLVVALWCGITELMRNFG